MTLCLQRDANALDGSLISSTLYNLLHIHLFLFFIQPPFVTGNFQPTINTDFLPMSGLHTDHYNLDE